MKNLTWLQAAVWLVLWGVMVTIVALILPGEQSWWAGSITIFLTGWISASIVARFR